MGQGAWRHSAALAIAVIALFVALGGSVYAAKRATIDGRAVRTKSLPGNRLKPGSVTGDRLKPHSIPANRLKRGVIPAVAADAPLTGADINELTLGQVPSAAHADSADTAQSAIDAQTALYAVSAVDAQTVNGHSVGCLPGTTPFGGACWQSSAGEAVNAPTAAHRCAAAGGELPDALALAAFGEQPGVNLSAQDEWSNDIVSFTAEDIYAVATVSANSNVGSGLFNAGGIKEIHPYRCVIPLVT